MKTALVTGASRGIGKAIALQLARDGYAVAVHCVRAVDAAQTVCDAIIARGGCAKVYVCDIADGEAVDAMVQSITHELGAVEVLVNNAGIAQQKLFSDITPAEWRQMMAVHVDGAYYTCRACLPHMIRQHTGAIVNVASMWGQVGASCEAAYSATKGAVIALSKALAKELGPSGIRVNCVAPGVILTDMCAQVTPAVLEEMAQESAVGRNGTPQDVAKAMVYLADAEFITGEVLSVNGGYVI